MMNRCEIQMYVFTCTILGMQRTKTKSLFQANVLASNLFSALQNVLFCFMISISFVIKKVVTQNECVNTTLNSLFSRSLLIRISQRIQRNHGQYISLLNTWKEIFIANFIFWSLKAKIETTVFNYQRNKTYLILSSESSCSKLLIW